MMSIAEMQRRSAFIELPAAPDSTADAFCRAYCAVGAAERAQGRRAEIGGRIAFAAVRVMQLANLLGANMQREIERKVARNRLRVYAADETGVMRRVSEAPEGAADAYADMPMQELQREIYQNKVDKGFNITDTNIEFCLIYGELNEAYDAYLSSPATVGEELADVMIYLMGLSAIIGAELHAELDKLCRRV